MSFLLRHNRAGAGDSKGALEDLQTIRRLGRLLQQEPALLSTLVGAAIESLSWQTKLTLARGELLTAAQRIQLAADARGTEEFRYNSDAFNTGERYFNLQLVMMAMKEDTERSVRVISGLEWVDFFNKAAKKPSVTLGDLRQTDWNVVLRMLNRDYDTLTAIASETDEIKQRDQALAFVAAHQAAQEAGITQSITFDISPDPDKEIQRQKFISNLEAYLRRRPNESLVAYSERIGIFFLGDQSSVERSFRLVLRPRTYQRQLQMVLALRAYHEAKGAYPATLNELVPAFLPKISTDPFAGKPMSFRREGDGYVLYSIGLNGKDDGGKTSREQKDADDIVVKTDH